MSNLAFAHLALIRKGYTVNDAGNHLSIVPAKVNQTVILLREYLGEGYSVVATGLSVRITVARPVALKGNQFSRNRAARALYLNHG